MPAFCVTSSSCGMGRSWHWMRLTPGGGGAGVGWPPWVNEGRALSNRIKSRTRRISASTCDLGIVQATIDFQRSGMQLSDAAQRGLCVVAAAGSTQGIRQEIEDRRLIRIQTGGLLQELHGFATLVQPQPCFSQIHARRPGIGIHATGPFQVGNPLNKMAGLDQESTEEVSRAGILRILINRGRQFLLRLIVSAKADVCLAEFSMCPWKFGVHPQSLLVSLGRFLETS